MSKANSDWELALVGVGCLVVAGAGLWLIVRAIGAIGALGYGVGRSLRRARRERAKARGIPQR